MSQALAFGIRPTYDRNMMKWCASAQYVVILVWLIVLPASLVAAAGQEEASADRGEYVAESGQIIPADEVHVHSYVSRIDYGYPDPSGPIGITMQTSHSRVSTAGQELLLQIGMQGRRGEFESIPRINIVFLFDASGSMSAPDKIAYVRKGMETLVSRLRPGDVLSVIAFSEEPRVILPATPMRLVDSEALVESVRNVLPDGIAEMEGAYREAHRQVSSNYDPDGINRILLLSDGLFETGNLLDLAEGYFDEGVGTTTIGMGQAFNLELMAEMGKAGGGSSRFLNDEEKIHEVFFTDLDRAIYPVAYRLEMQLRFLQPVEILGHWGYNGVTQEQSVTFSHPSVHFRDYETILVKVRTAPTTPGRRPLAVFETEYRDLAGTRFADTTDVIEVDYAQNVVPAEYAAITDVVLGATILHVADGLKQIGELFHSANLDSERVAETSQANWGVRNTTEGVPFTSLVLRERGELTRSTTLKIRRCLDLTLALRREVQNTSLRLDTDIFAGELTILDAYVKTLGRRLSIGDHILELMVQESIVDVPAQPGSLESSLQAVADELLARVVEGGSERLLFSGFVARESGYDRLVDRMNGDFAATLARSDVTRVPAARFTATINRLQVTAADMFNTEVARTVGRELGADLLVSGYLLPFDESLVLFARLSSTETGEVRSVAQTVVTYTDDIQELIDTGR